MTLDYARETAKYVDRLHPERNKDALVIPSGNPADLIVLDCRDVTSAVCELAQPLLGLKGGRRSFTRRPVILHHP